MRNAAFALIAALAFAPAAFAQDPPAPPAGGATPAPAPAKPDEKPAPAKPAAPAKHENKVTDAAKGAFEAIHKAMHDPVAAGLKELQGNLVFKIEFEAMEGMEDQMAAMEGMKIDFAVDFKAPTTLAVSGKTDNPMLEMQLEHTQRLVEMFLLFSSGVFEPKAGTEFDADVVTVEGKKSLVLSTFEKNVAGPVMKFGLEANGLPGKGTMTMIDPMMGIEQTVDTEFKFQKDGEKFRFEKYSITQPGSPEAVEFAATYADLGGFRLLSGIQAGLQTPMGAAKLLFKYDSLKVNGTKVELPKEAPKKTEPAKTEETKGEEKPVEKKPEAPKEEPPK